MKRFLLVLLVAFAVGFLIPVVAADAARIRVHHESF